MVCNARKIIVKCDLSESCNSCFKPCAPALLEACKELLNCISDDVDEYTCYEYYKIVHKKADKAKTAIEEATK